MDSVLPDQAPGPRRTSASFVICDACFVAHMLTNCRSMVTTRAGARATGQTPAKTQPPPLADLAGAVLPEVAKKVLNGKKTWAETDGAGEHIGAWGIEGAAGAAFAYSGALALMIGCPAFAIYM